MKRDLEGGLKEESIVLHPTSSLVPIAPVSSSVDDENDIYAVGKKEAAIKRRRVFDFGRKIYIDSGIECSKRY